MIRKNVLFFLSGLGLTANGRGPSLGDSFRDLRRLDGRGGRPQERLKPEPIPSLAAEGTGAINIEGLSAWKAGQLLIGFRNPVPGGRALLVPLENPGELISQPGKTARFGTPIQLDLGGRGIRSIEYWKDRDLYLIVEIKSADLNGLNPEAVVIYPGIKNRFQVLSDDGDEGGCKGLADEDPNKKFRSRWIEFP